LPEGVTLMSNADFDESTVPRQALVGSSILQIVATMQDRPDARTALNSALALVQSGARALVASEAGPLVDELRSFGGEWVQFGDATANPFRLRSNARRIESLVTSERIDIVHTHSLGGAWSTRTAASRIAVWFVATLPDVPLPTRGLKAGFAHAIARADRIIAPSMYAAAPMMERFGITEEDISVIPRSLDTAVYDPAIVKPHRLAALLNAWDIPQGERVVMVPGRVAPWNGQLMLPEVARALCEGADREPDGNPGVVFVLVGEHQRHRKYTQAILKQAQAHGVEHMFRLAGDCADMPAAFAAADVVALPAIESPVYGRVVAQAQAMARPVVTTAVGLLPEYLVAPPRLPEDLRTGWVVPPGDPTEFAHGIWQALELDNLAYRGLAARAREFAQYMFSPQSAAETTCAVYASLLARDR
jgi:glycosyltransferase involved in cell wall biosynthesis